MTYFTFERKPFRRGARAFVGTRPVGRVYPTVDWHAALTCADHHEPRYRLVTLDGFKPAEVYDTQHEAAEALLAYDFQD